MSRPEASLFLAAWLAAGSVLAATAFAGTPAADLGADPPAAAPAGPGASPPDPVLKVWVRLADKGPSPGSRGLPASGPGAGPASRAYEDLPVHEAYVSALEAEGFACDTRIKWQNLVSGRIPASGLARLRGLPFVAGVSELPRKAPGRKGRRWAPWIPGPLRKPAADRGDAQPASPGGAGSLPDLGAFRALADSLNILEVLDWLAAAGMRPGEGMRVAVIDEDFDFGHAAFAHLLAPGRVKDQYDFVGRSPQAVTGDVDYSHGAECLSFIGAYLPGVYVGAAYAADFLLYNTEDPNQESYVEEDYLAAAIERAVDSGARVISISVVYRTEFDATPDIPLVQMDGRTRPASLAALGAARRDVLVVSAMGNWDRKQDRASSLSVPADADSILAASMASPAGTPCADYTTGPTADGRIKPELVSMGIQSCGATIPDSETERGMYTATGSSFAAPAVAAIAVLLRQAQPGRSAQDIRGALLATARNAAAPSNTVGWGFPDAWAALGRLQVSIRPIPSVTRTVPSGPRFDAAGRRLPAAAPAAGMRFARPGAASPAAGPR